MFIKNRNPSFLKTKNHPHLTNISCPCVKCLHTIVVYGFNHVPSHHRPPPVYILYIWNKDSRFVLLVHKKKIIFEFSSTREMQIQSQSPSSTYEEPWDRGRQQEQLQAKFLKPSPNAKSPEQRSHRSHSDAHTHNVHNVQASGQSTLTMFISKLYNPLTALTIGIGIQYISSRKLSYFAVILFAWRYQYQYH